MTSKRSISRRLDALGAPESGIREMPPETFWGFKMKCPAENYPETEFVEEGEEELIVRYDGELMRITEATIEPHRCWMEADR